MKYKKITRRDLSGVGVIGLPDTPELSTEDMQAKFEQTAREVIIPRHNRLIDRLTERGQPVESENLVRIKKGADGDLMMSPDGSKWEGVAQKALSKKRDSSSVFTKEETLEQIDRKVYEIGSADMTKAVYDRDNDGVVDRAKKADAASSAASASAASKLSPGTKINGVSFDGSKEITVRDDTKLPLTGGEITGRLTFKGESVDIYYHNPLQNRNAPAIRFRPSTTNGNGDAILIGNGGMTLVAAGDNVRAFYEYLLSTGLHADDEQLDLISDGSIYLYPGLNDAGTDFAKARRFIVSGNGTFYSDTNIRILNPAAVQNSCRNIDVQNRAGSAVNTRTIVMRRK